MDSPAPSQECTLGMDAPAVNAGLVTVRGAIAASLGGGNDGASVAGDASFTGDPSLAASDPTGFPPPSCIVPPLVPVFPAFPVSSSDEHAATTAAAVRKEASTALRMSIASNKGHAARLCHLGKGREGVPHARTWTTLTPAWWMADA
jgi:hypothetical protein